MTVDGVSRFSANELALLNEAVRRVETSRGHSGTSRSVIVEAVSTALRQGRRDLFGLVKAGVRAA
ncbi:hypothetical protein [Lichenifustis flavocetrariae]|uniref:Uncharacterized protein n=1 Tax=Lichenifustis flavocetrariae TaxID=2949735 RepID=A0AA41YT12_9HYPH|nr:hypothetical protein [Lichenifustis flavocetrariae]MCW6508054.1 hypothetical protein [Lichenifustis flavocetrariae]